MAININADTTNGLVITPDTSGNINFQSGGATVAGVNSTGLTGNGSQLTGISSYADSDALTLFNASGSAPVYACRAWVVYNPQTQTILSSGNVSSVTYTATGRFTVNLQTAMPDANFATMGLVGQNDSATGNHSLCEYSALRTSSAIGVISSTVGGTETNEPYWSVTVVR